MFLFGGFWGSKKETLTSATILPFSGFIFSLLSHSVLGVTLELRNTRIGASQGTFIAQIIPQNEKLPTRASLHFGVGNDCQWKPSRDVASTSPEPFMGPELNYQSDHWPAKIVSFPPSFTPLTLGKLIWDSRTLICSYQHGHMKWIFAFTAQLWWLAGVGGQI